MKKIGVVMFAMTIVCLFGSTKAFAQSGPALDTLVKLDESRYDVSARSSVTRDDVLHRTSKQVFNREIFMVKERPMNPLYIVQEQQYVTRTVRDAVPVWVVVDPNAAPPVVKDPSWRYRIR